MAIDLERVLDARPAWVTRARTRLLTRLLDDPGRRRAALAATVVVWQLGEVVAPRRLVPPLRSALLAMVLFDSVATWVWVRTGLAMEGNPLVATLMAQVGDGVGLTLRTIWSAGLVVALCWLAERRAVVRPALVVVVLALGAVTLLHAAALGWVWGQLI